MMDDDGKPDTGEWDVDFTGLNGADTLADAFAALRAVTDTYLTKAETAELCRAASYGAKAHDGQKRKSGEPYFVHPIEVCRILAQRHFELAMLQAGLLHDVLEDTEETRIAMAQRFGNEVTTMVDGVSKLQSLKDEGPQEILAGSFQKMLFATADDPRVVIIKLADRLHNMKTLGAMRPEKRIRKATETFDVYIPIAKRMGLFYFQLELEDLVFSHLHPWRHRILQKAYQTRLVNTQILDRVGAELTPLWVELGIRAKIVRRQRHLWGIYERMKRKGNKFSAACQTNPLRIIAESEDDCYRILGCVHRLYRPIAGKFRDFIAAPASDGYRSLHTSVLLDKDTVLNIQIRTQEMHQLSEMGLVAACYQHDRDKDCSLRAQTHMAQTGKHMRNWLARLKEVRSLTVNPEEFYDTVKKELIQGDIYVYTPHGSVIDLPQGATPIDFAYAVHTRLGDQCIAAKVNGEDFPLSKPLSIGQTVEIIRDESSRPKAGWLRFVVTIRAKTAIRHYIRHLEEQEAIAVGERLFDIALCRLGSNLNRLDEQALTAYLETLNLSREALFASFGYNRRNPMVVASKLVGQQLAEENEQVLSVYSALDSAIHFGDCCYPLPFEPILGHLKSGVGVKIHRQQCIQAQNSNTEDWIPVAWAAEPQGYFETVLDIIVEERKGMLASITQTVGEFGANIDNISISEVNDDTEKRLVRCWLQVRNRDHLATIMRHLRIRPGIVEIKRL